MASTQKLLVASKWSFFTEVTVKIVPPLAFVVLSRILAPKDYGIVSIAMIVVSFVQIFCDFGLSRAIIQRNFTAESLPEALDTAFWINVVIGIFFFLIIFIFSSPLARMLGNSDASTAIKVLSLNILAYSLSALQSGYAQRNLNFKSIFWARLASSILPYTVSIPLAFSGLGYWALVGGNVAGSFAGMVLLWILSDWKPRFRFSRSQTKNMLGFGLWNATEGIAGWGITWIDSLIVSFYFLTAQLGLYRNASNFTDLAFMLILSPVLPVLFSFLSRNQTENVAFNGYFLKANKIICFSAFPVGIIFFFYSKFIQTVIYGSKWVGIAELLAILGLGKGLKTIFSINGEAYRAKGKPSFNTLIMIMSTCIYIPFLMWSASKKSLYIYAIVKSIIVFVQIPFHAVALKKITGIGFFETTKNLGGVFAASATMACTCYVLSTVLKQSIFMNITGVAVSTLVYFSCILVIDKDFVLSLIGYIKKTTHGNIGE